MFIRWVRVSSNTQTLNSTMSYIDSWLTGLGLDYVIPKLKANGITTPKKLAMLTLRDMFDVGELNFSFRHSILPLDEQFVEEFDQVKQNQFFIFDLLFYDFG